MKEIISNFYVVIVLSLFSFNYVKCDTDGCNFGTCGECISSRNCVWCAQEEYKDHRCFPVNYLSSKRSQCKPEYIFNPQPQMNVIQNQEFGEKRGGSVVQLKPQLIKIKARPGVDINFNVSYKPAKDYPLDVYYLMDISYTMVSKINDLKLQAQAIYADLSQYTNNVRLGIGSFVEKPGFPFVDPNKHISYAFKNHISLTENTTKFTQTIDNIHEFGSNFDDPEDGLDALMQSMKCVKEIGWRSGARRIIVLCTDSTYHSAGDGKIVGAIKPHDMQCHLENNLYTQALTYDYPSVSQIDKVAQDGHFIIIFAITRNNLTNYLPETEYKALAKQIVGANYAKLESGTSVINIIHEAYNTAARRAELKFEAPPFIQISAAQNCKSDPKVNCETTHTQPTVIIPVNLTIMSCPTNNKLKHQVKITQVGLDDTLTLEVEIDCQCDCEKKAGTISPKCHNSGILQCGICKCNPGSYGVDCRCDGTSTDQIDMEKCKATPDSKLCSGRGKCRCGKCEDCQKGFSGDYCEFDDNSCPRPNNQMCSGRGVCRRGQCECDAHWTENDCSCPDHDLDCFAPYSKEVCSGNGICKCGVCICNALEGKNETYSGVFCDNCEECAEKRCKELEDYAYCNYEKMNKTVCDEQNNGTTTGIDVTFMNKTEINGPTLYMAKWCKKELKNGTYIVFKYQYEHHDLNLIIQKELELPPEANIWIAVGSAIGLVLLIGILTVIIWKILVDLHDKREYKKFADEAVAAGYDVSLNPLYQEPAINFSNPVYNQGL